MQKNEDRVEKICDDFSFESHMHTKLCAQSQFWKWKMLLWWKKKRMILMPHFECFHNQVNKSKKKYVSKFEIVYILDVAHVQRCSNQEIRFRNGIGNRKIESSLGMCAIAIVCALCLYVQFRFFIMLWIWNHERKNVCVCVKNDVFVPSI